MSGTRGGTGCPIVCRCGHCRRSTGYTSATRKGYGIAPTGRVRRLKRPKGGARMDSWHAYEYRCPDCGRTGWTRHNDFARRFRDAGHSTPPV